MAGSYVTGVSGILIYSFYQCILCQYHELVLKNTELNTERRF